MGITHAALLRDIPVTLEQPDGSQLLCFTSGDEYHAWLHDSEGLPIIQSHQDGYYYYGIRKGDSLVPSKHRAGQTLQRNSEVNPWSGITPSAYRNKRAAYWEGVELFDAPSVGTINNINIFIRFAGEGEFRNECTDFTEPFNKEDGPSMKHYFNEVSYGLLEVITHHYPACGTSSLSYQDGHTRAYYQPYNAATNDSGYVDCWPGHEDPEGLNCEDFPESQHGHIREHTLLKNAIESIRSQIPTNLDVDSDDDGKVDNVTFLVNGSPTGWSDLLWPHRWSLTSFDVPINGAIVDAYNLNLASGNPTYFTVGVLCHEFAHSLGLPDLYHYVDSPAPTPVGGWDVMEQTSDPPQYMSAWMKHRYTEWLDCDTLTSRGTYQLNPLQQQAGSCFLIESPYSDTQLFSLEYRNQEGIYDVNLPGSQDGLLIYRINLDLNANGKNDITEEDESWNGTIGGNADGPPDEVYVYRPGGTSTYNGNLLDALFSAERGQVQFNDGTDPSSFLVETYTDENENGEYDEGEPFKDDNGDNLYGDRPGGLHILNVGIPKETISFDYDTYFLFSKIQGIKNDNDNDGVLNPGETALVQFTTDIFGEEEHLSNVEIELSGLEDFISFNPSLIQIENSDLLSLSLPIQFQSEIMLMDNYQIQPADIQLKISAKIEEGGVLHNYVDTQSFTMDISLNQKGFPFDSGEIRATPLIIEGESEGDAAIVFGNFNGEIQTVSPYGNHLGNQYPNYNSSMIMWGSPARGDMTGDGNPEVVFTAYSNDPVCTQCGAVFILNLENELVSFHSDLKFVGTPSLGNLDDDPQLEMVFSSYSKQNNQLFALNYDLSPVNGFPVLINERSKPGSALADFNQNGKDDIVIGSDDGNLYVYDDSGELASGFPFTAEGKFHLSPSIIEFENEKYILAPCDDKNLYIVKGNGELLKKIPLGSKPIIPVSFTEKNGTAYAFLATRDNYLHAFDLYGSSLPGWPVETEDEVQGGVVFADLDNNSEPEIITTLEKGEWMVYNWDGSTFPYFPISIGFPFSSPPTVADINGDGDLELLAGSGGTLEVLDIKSTGTVENYWNMYRGNPQRTGHFKTDSILDISIPEFPGKFILYPAYPNPFNPVVHFQLDIPVWESIKIEVIDLQGRVVTPLNNGELHPGRHIFTWNGGSYGSGIYFIRVESSDEFHSSNRMIHTEKIVLIK